MKSVRRSERKAARKVNRAGAIRCPLVMVEWEDSRQPSPGWVYLASLDPVDAVRCVSVGWLVEDGIKVKALAPNMGDFSGESSVQVSGVIRIPTRCIVRVVELQEPDVITFSSVSVPSSRPGTKPNPQAS